MSAAADFRRALSSIKRTQTELSTSASLNPLPDAIRHANAIDLRILARVEARVCARVAACLEAEARRPTP